MSYLGYTRLMNTHCKLFDVPKVLEIGVDRGQTALPLVANLAQLNSDFVYLGLDVRLDQCFAEQVAQIFGARVGTEFPSPDSNVFYTIRNSLDVLPLLAKMKYKFDLILIDGDHNYSTVKKELSYLRDISHTSTMVICDDYSGRHANKDTFYRDYESHKENLHIQGVELPKTEKQGVNQAIDEWIAENSDYKLYNFTDGEPCMIVPPHLAVSSERTTGQHLHDIPWKVTIAKNTESE